MKRPTRRPDRFGGAGRAASGARGGARAAGRSPRLGRDDTANEPQMKQTPAPRKISEAIPAFGFLPHIQAPEDEEAAR